MLDLTVIRRSIGVTLGLMCDACEAAYGDIRLTVRTLERIRNHAHSGDDPALLAQQELDRIRREGRA
jgi:hypothetical protein